MHCALRLDLDHRSDYFPIETMLAIELVLASVRQRRSWKSLNKDIVALGAQGLRQPPAGVLSANNIETYTNYLIGFIQELVSHLVPWAKPSYKANPWWTNEIQSLV